MTSEAMEEEVVEEQDYPNFDRNQFSFLSHVTKDEQQEVTSEFNYVRPMRAIIEFLNNPHGSVKLFQGDSCIVAAAYGPSDVRMSKELPHRAAVDVLYRPKIMGTPKAFQELGLDSIVKERSFESMITSVFDSTFFLEDDPTAGFNIILQEVENDGCLLSCCINTAYIALLDGSCSLRCMIAAVTVLVVNDTQFIVDPSVAQIKQGYQVMATFALTNDDEISLCHQKGRASPIVLLQCFKVAKLAASEIFKFYYLLMKRKYLK